MSMQAVESFCNRNGLRGKIEELIIFVEQAARDRVAAHEVEKWLWEKVLELGHEAYGMFFHQCGDGDEGAQVTLPAGRKVKKLRAPHRRIYQSVFGRFELERVVYGTREGQKIEYVPLDEYLQLPASRFSYLLQDWDQSLVVETPYAQVNMMIGKILGFSQSVHSLERSNRSLADDVSEFWDKQPTPPANEEGALLVCTADGKGVPIRGEAKAPPIEGAQVNPGPKPGRKKMAMVGSVYTVDRFKRTPEEVLGALFHLPGETTEPAPCRPEPIAKHIRTSLIRDADGTSQPSYDEIFGWMAQAADLRNAAGDKPLILLMDGQESLWNAGLKHLPESRKVIEILDLIHVASYLWKAANLFHSPNSSEASAFVKKRMEQLLHGKVNSVIRGLRWMSTHHHLTGKRAEALATVCRYFANNSHRMAYNDYLAAGYPIASGVIEGACRHVVKDRMERSGMRWILDGAHSMLSLRCIALSGFWNDFMQFHIERETLRLYSCPAANDADIHPRLFG